MRKRNFEYYLNAVFWFLVLLLPVLFLLVVLCQDGYAGMLSTLGAFDVHSFAGILYQPMFDFFSVFGMGVTYSNIFVVISAYLIYVELARISLDVLLFLPRFCRSWFDGSKGGSLWH